MGSKVCPTCGKEFVKRTGSQIYCSWECRINNPTRCYKNKFSKLLIEKYGNTCSYCGCDLSKVKAHVDHIIPRSLGGTDEIENLALSCYICNFAKSIHSVKDFITWLLYIKREAKLPILTRFQDINLEEIEELYKNRYKKI